MRTVALAMVLLGGVALFSQEVKNSPKHSSGLVLTKFCGRIQLAGPKARVDDAYDNSHTKGLHGVLLQLYSREPAKECCDIHELVTETKTGMGGRFNFYRADDGPYWLVAHYRDHSYTLALDVKKDTRLEKLCGDQQFVIWPDGSFDMKQYVMVD